jgi:lipopolysaccharide heptosyltransferase I
MKILIVKVSALGDVIHTLPALTILRRRYPEAQITWLAEPGAAELIRGHPALNRVILWPRGDWQRYGCSGKLVRLARSVRAFVRELRDTRYDLIIDFQGSLKAALWVALARGPRKAGYGPGMHHDEYSWLVHNERVPAVSNEIHAVERNLLLLEGLGIPRLPLIYDLAVPPEADQEAGALLAAAGLSADTPFVAIHPRSRWRTKNWPPERFAHVAEGLHAHGLSVVWTGGPDDRADVDAICAALPGRAIRVDGQTPLKTLAAIFRRAQVVLSTDTGPIHIAVAVGTPVVGLFGPTSPASTGPYGEGHTVIRVDLACSPCFKKTCRTRQYEKHACMLRLSVAEVIRAVLDQVARRAPHVIKPGI